ncbi:MAG: hypothetical protein NT062_38070, partial [Proteobacteria bacterium]|nr:hypothetical protein [Pseudomonadota bacterium]
ALAEAIAATVRPTAVASLGAMVAYGSLAATSFRGFSDFAIIGAVGMLVCWVATYGLLPVMLLCHAREARAVVDERWIGRLIVRIFGIRRRGIALAVAGIVLLGSGVIVARYLVGDPFEYDMRELGSVGATSEAERHWMATADAKFGRGRAGRTIIAVDRDDQVASVVGALAAPERAASVGSVESILSVVPEVQDQHAKLVVLSEIRKLIDDPALDALEEAEHAEILALRPPDDVAMITRGMLPPSLLALVTDRMGVVGRMISVRPADGMDELDGHAMMRFAAAVRRIELPDHSTVTTSGASVIFADILETIARDGPLVTAIAVAGIVLVVLAVVGRDRLAVAVLAATACGTLAMVAICALLGARVTFLDFVALPITLGLGVDYAINVAHRREVVRDSIAVLRTTGVAVLVCSVTTMIGYASLLASDNLTIRGFGRASLIGEITTVVSALFLVPAVLGAGRR